MHAGVDGAIDDRLEAPGGHSIVRVKRCHENPGNAGQGPAKFGIDCHLRTAWVSGFPAREYPRRPPGNRSRTPRSPAECAVQTAGNSHAGNYAAAAYKP